MHCFLYEMQSEHIEVCSVFRHFLAAMFCTGVRGVGSVSAAEEEPGRL